MRSPYAENEKTIVKDQRMSARGGGIRMVPGSPEPIPLPHRHQPDQTMVHIRRLSAGHAVLSTMAFMADRITCDLCGTAIAPHAHYIVRIDVFADPSMPPVSTE